jgi:hypothetical protein
MNNGPLLLSQMEEDEKEQDEKMKNNNLYENYNWKELGSLFEYYYYCCCCCEEEVAQEDFHLLPMGNIDGVDILAHLHYLEEGNAQPLQNKTSSFATFPSYDGAYPPVELCVTNGKMRVFLCFLFISFIFGQNQNFEKATARAIKLSHVPSSFQPEPYSSPHRNVSNAIFAVAMGNFMPRYFRLFLGSLRRTGYDGDVVIATDELLTQDALNAALVHQPVIYKVTPECLSANESLWRGQKQCGIAGQRGPKVSVNMLRYYFYNWWATRYEPDTAILITDFTDVIFQSNPFTYMPELWRPPVAHLAIFLEALPQKVEHDQLTD